MQSTELTTYPTPSLRIHRTAVDLAAILLLVGAVLAVAAIATWQFWHADRIYTGVSVAGVPLGGLTRAGALNLLSRELAPYPAQPIVLTDGERHWPLPTAQLGVHGDLLDAVNRAYLVGRQGDLADGLRAQWQALLRGAEIVPHLSLDPGQVHYLVSQIAVEVRRPGRAASQLGSITVPAQPGVDVDVAGTVQAVLQALQEDRPALVQLETITLPPPSAETNQPAGNSASPGWDPLILADRESGLRFALDPMALKRIVLSREPLRLDQGLLREVVSQWAAQIAITAQDARLHFNPATGAVTVRQPSVNGRRLDVEATLENVRLALAGGHTTTALPVQSVAPAVDMNRISEMGIVELVAAGTTYFAGSSRDRIHNIEVAAAKFEGVVIPPGEIFSFNEIVEEVSAANGFEDSLIIWGDRTAVGIGGGVCQVSTTVFRAAFNAGFPIVERYNHGYVVSWYGKPGLDATIYTPTVDFRFRNDTEAYLLVQPVVDSVAGTITYNFYGTKPDRQVTIGEPVITDIQEPGPPVFQEDPSLAPGQQRQVEWAKQGMTATVERVVVDANGERRVDKLVSHYQPWQAVYLVGPGTQVPAGESETESEPADTSS